MIMGSLAGNGSSEKRKVSLFWGLIKFELESKYEKGYWLDLILRGREFKAPVTFIPIEMRYGFGFNGKLSGSFSNPSANTLASNDWLEFEQEVQDFRPGITEMIGTSMEADILLYNLADKIVQSNWMDVVSGITYRTSGVIAPATIPYSEWGSVQPSWGQNKKFSPQMTEYLVTTHMLWQGFEPWFLDFRYSYGLARAKFYADNDNKIFDDSPSGTGTSMGMSLGFRYIIDPGKMNRFTVGVDLRHSYTKISTISDANDVTPISRFDLANYGIYFTLSAFYGGQKTIGDQGKKHYYERDYITARRELREFIGQFPNHANRYRAEEYIEKCNYKIPYQIMDEGIALDDQGSTKEALDRYLLAKSLVVDDTLIVKTLEHRILQIAGKWMNRAELLLKDKYYSEAYALVQDVAAFSELGKKELNRFHSYAVLDKGKKAQKYGFISRSMDYYAEALSMNQDLKYEVQALQYQAGIQLAELASTVDEFEEIQLAIYSLEMARELSKDIGPKNEKLLIELKTKLELLDEHKARKWMDEKMNLARQKQSLARSPRLEVGLSLPQVEILMGHPHETVHQSGNNQNEQLWIYRLDNGVTLQLSFLEFALIKIEEK